MKCPVDGATLVMTERQGVEIDYCPTCRGVWLDRGELDKIIDRSLVDQPVAAPVTKAEPVRDDPYHPRPDPRPERQPEARADTRPETRDRRDDDRDRDRDREWRRDRDRDDDDDRYKRKRRKSFLDDLFDF
jgi:Zn-finger nucleic acid-binding protein